MCTLNLIIIKNIRPTHVLVDLVIKRKCLNSLLTPNYTFEGKSCNFSFQPVLHDWCNKGRGMCYPVCGMMHIKEPLLLLGKSSPCGGSGFPLSLSEWSFTICPTPYNRKENVLSASLNKTFPSFLPKVKRNR